MSTQRDPKLSRDEWHLIRCRRGVKLTGFPSHTHVHDGVPYTYFWPMGSQPIYRVRHTICNRCPVKAAATFLAFYKPLRTRDRYEIQHAKPTLRADAPEWMAYDQAVGQRL